MRFYLLDDDVSMLRMLANLIEDHDLGMVVKQQTNPEEALKELPALAVDICIIDYLMPKVDGSAVMRKIKATPGGESIDFIMVSQVEDHVMVEGSYESGAELVLHKPLNAIAFKKVVGLISERRSMQVKLEQIRQFLVPQAAATRQPTTPQMQHVKHRQRIEHIMSELGMMGERGCEDILRICLLMLEKNRRGEQFFNEAVIATGERPQTVTQRMRRAIAKGLTTMAHMGMEDMGQEAFQSYAYRLFDAQSIRDEIARMRGKQPYGGKVNLFQFISALLVLGEP